MARAGKDIAFEWLRLNGLPLPNTVAFSREEHARLNPTKFEKLWLGFHVSKRGKSHIAVSVEDCDFSNRFQTPVGWFVQAPGSFEDYSPIGVFCHEVGHHVDYALNPRAYSRSKASGFPSVVDDEEEVSRGEYNVHESFAEAIRLFVTNPDLLRRGRPERWEHIVGKLKLKPLHDEPWQRVLSKAPLYVKRSVVEWLVDS
jgi:hypothetical protein